MTATPPRLLVAVLGTHTEVGKTWVCAGVAAELRARGLTVAARKPVQSFDPDDPHPTDGAVLGAATGEDADAVCAPERSLPVPMAPPMAADVLGLPRPVLADLVDEVRWPDRVDVGFLETVGGCRSPVATDGDSADLARHAGADRALLVADAELGTIDRVRSGLVALDGMPTLVVLNRFDPDDDLHRRNLAWLRAEGTEVETAVSTTADRLATVRR